MAEPTTRNHLLAALRGPLVPVLTAFNGNEHDFDSTCAWVASLIDRGIRMFWTTHGTSHYMCLTDEEILELSRAVAAVTRGRAVFVASTAYHWPAERCIEFCRKAADWGVDSVKVQIDWRTWPPTDEQLLEHYSRIAKESPLPLFAYTWGKPAIRPPLLRRIIDLPQFIGLKNDSGDFAEHTEYLRIIRDSGIDFVAMTGGTMESFLHGYAFGARAFACGTAVYAPRVALDFYSHLTAGRQADAVKVITTYEQPVMASFAEMGTWACFHHALRLQGKFKSAAMRFPLRSLDAAQQDRVERLLRERQLIG